MRLTSLKAASPGRESSAEAGSGHAFADGVTRGMCARPSPDTVVPPGTRTGSGAAVSLASFSWRARRLPWTSSDLAGAPISDTISATNPKSCIK